MSMATEPARTLAEQIREACEAACASGHTISVSIDILPGESYEDVATRISSEISANISEEVSPEEYTGVSEKGE